MEDLLQDVISHIKECARIPSFSSYEERLHPYIKRSFSSMNTFSAVEVPGNNLIFDSGATNNDATKTIALAAHLDKINHYGKNYPGKLPVVETDGYLEGIMDDATGLGILLGIAGYLDQADITNRYLFFFSEMEESKGLREHPELLKNGGQGYDHGMGAKNISRRCMELNIWPDLVVTVDTTPLFEGDPGIALYSKHWELNDLEATSDLVNNTRQVVDEFIDIDSTIKLDNNTNDYLHYGYEFNTDADRPVVSIALEPAIYPYHQLGEQVYKKDIARVVNILITHLVKNR